jgi:hypothetical protein
VSNTVTPSLQVIEYPDSNYLVLDMICKLPLYGEAYGQAALSGETWVSILTTETTFGSDVVVLLGRWTQS